MANLIIDLTNYKERSSARVEPGEYLAIVEDVEVTKTSERSATPGVPMIVTYLAIPDADGATIVDRLTLTDKAMFRVVGFMNALGIPTPKKRLQVNPDQWKGRKLRVVLKDGEPYNDVIRSEVAAYHKLQAPAKAEAEAGDDVLDALSGDESFLEEKAEAEAAPAAPAEPTPAPTATEAPASAGNGGVDDVALDDIEI